ncbi:MAG: radical SAM family heme chaperone HemW [Flavobacteriaceae bacterium]|nr:radical SAM family heme chaperone HemW [Flavobacteriaceae bacterium]
MAGIYIHIPFCKQACYYCNFHFSTSLKKKNDMLSAFKTELLLRKDELNNQTIESIYFGGGTPSLLDVEDIERLITLINIDYQVSETAEITMEANPDDLIPEKIHQLSKSPINRLSIGIQSFFDDDLKSMNRAHSSLEAKSCLEIATKAFDNITIDLIYGIPNMSLKKWNQNLQLTFDFGIKHISSYALTVEPKTALHTFIKKGDYPRIDEDLALQHFNHLVQETEKKGLVQYEISNFGKPGYFSKHNTSYWQGKHYLGIGPSAHSFNGKQRSWNISNNIKYIQSINQYKLPLEIEKLSQKDRFNEYVMTGFRTIWGVSLDTVEVDFGLKYKTQLLKTAEKYMDEGLLVNENNILKTTKKGKFLADGIASELFMI